MSDRAQDEREPPEVPTSAAEDTPPEVRAMMIEGYRRMSPAEKLQRVVDLNRAVESLARARVRLQYGPNLSQREEDLRIASLQLGREIMVRVFGWDPEIEGW